ncbi:putative disease resistance protein At1g50180 [Panicum virgatum]|uniref:putative disease resistance protein At1g50180 n=1 Tax=Panicum virgatum TaxID=38727 RepID=UPI0019D63F4A|nr:putative disease resistance protein At1g50180 [Panicum virgatum]
MPSIILKLRKLLKEEYNLQAGVKKHVRSLTLELERWTRCHGTTKGGPGRTTKGGPGAMELREVDQAALGKVDQVPWNQLDEHVKLWAHEVRESSYDMEDSLDTFLAHIQGREATKREGLLKCLIGKMPNLVKKSKKRRKISIGVKDIMTHVNEPLQRGDATNAKMKIVSVVGVGGLGKTTLAKAVYEKLKDDFDCKAFVPVGRNPDLKKVFKDILIDLDSDRDLQLSMAILDERMLINKIRKFFIDNKKSYGI